jgi:tyrosyl-tRNA synthetase
MVNNLDWTAPMSAIDFLREIGKHYRVGTMLKKDAVAAPELRSGISYTEFSYQILQGMDYLSCTASTTACCRPAGPTSGATSPAAPTSSTASKGLGARDRHALITNSDGTKFGKSEGNAIWLDAEMCSPYRMYQFWLSPTTPTSSSDSRSSPHARRDRAVRGDGRRRAVPSCRAEAPRPRGDDRPAGGHGRGDRGIRGLFGAGDLGALDAATLRTAWKSCRTRRSGHHGRAGTGGDGTVCELSEARRSIAQGGVSLDGTKVDDESTAITGALPELRCSAAARRRSPGSSSHLRPDPARHPPEAACHHCLARRGGAAVRPHAAASG